ncbi:MAG TPA: glycoside hydrolase 100 family protein [Thiobacillaceae bacterium]|nr:glycoside hydrolase 100 family protein [Thiobacillaceae bacterium]
MQNEAHSPSLIEQCLNASRQMLRRNLTSQGILAASRTPEAEARQYTRVFGRDAAICALGMLASGDADLKSGARSGLLTLARRQADNGQIPKYVDTERDEADFWYLGCIDATLWWLIALKLFARHLPDDGIEAELAEPIEKALTWLKCQEHPQIFLLRQDEASDWADIMPRSGFVLYSNALWYYVKRLYGLAHAEQTKFHFNHLFFPFSSNMPDYRRLRLLTHYVRNRAKHNGELYLSFVNFSFWGEEGDVFGNLLAVLLGLADDGPANRILHALQRVAEASPCPIATVLQPISPADPLWRRYMGRHRQNLEWQYHNGGAWPFIGGFWVMTLAALGKQQAASEYLGKLAMANAAGGWAFREWFHGKTGEPGGMAGQSWNAAMFLLAHHALDNKVF